MRQPAAMSERMSRLSLRFPVPGGVGRALMLALALTGGALPQVVPAQTAPGTGAGAAPAATPAQRPGRPEAPRVTVTRDGLQPIAQLGRYLASVSVPPEAAANPVLGPEERDPEARFLRQWVFDGTAAGLAGVFYDNRDNGHSRLSARRFPQLTHIDYDEELRAREAHRSLAHAFLFPGPVLGNASLAITGGMNARSLPRLAMTTPSEIAQAFVGYANNHLYVYPGHMDLGRGGGDVLPAMVPYFPISRGSSSSDRPLLDAMALALASMRPETRARLEAEGLIAPTLVMLLRFGLRDTEGYLDPRAHPASIHRDRLRPGLMMSVAHDIRPDEIPPMVRLRVLTEDFGDAAGLAQKGERLFDTPSAVARLWRNLEWTRSIVVSTAGTRDPNDRALEFHWLLLAGDPERVRIVPLDPAGRRARIEVDWHDAPFASAGRDEEGSRVEIGVIAWNGARYSAPAFVTVAFPAHQERIYAPGPDGRMRLASVDYDALARDAPFDPVLWWEARWRDEPIYDAGGHRVGWQRHYRSGRSEAVPDDRPGTYEMQITRNRPPRLRWEADPEAAIAVP
jgi:hypothetical protein